MAIKIGSLLIDIATNVARVQKDFSKVEGRLKKFERTASTIMKGVGAAITVAMAVKGVTGMNRFVRSTVAAIDNLEDLAQGAGVSIRTFQAMAQQAKYARVEETKLSSAMRRLNTNLIDANVGLKESQRYFKLLNIEYKDAQGNIRDTTEVIYEIADAFKDMEDGSFKAGVASKLLGRSGASMIPVFNDGADAIDQTNQRLERFGSLISKETAAKTNILNRNFIDLDAAVHAVGLQLMTGLADPLLQVTTAIIESVEAGDKLIIAGKVIGDTLIFVAKGAYITAAGINTVGTTIGWVAKKMTDWSNIKMGALSDEIWKINDSLNATLETLSKPVEIDVQAQKARGGAGAFEQFEEGGTGGKNNENLFPEQQKMEDVYEALREEAFVLRMSAEEQAGYNAAKKAGIDIWLGTTHAKKTENQATLDLLMSMAAENEQFKLSISEREKISQKNEAVANSTGEVVKNLRQEAFLFGKSEEEQAAYNAVKQAGILINYESGKAAYANQQAMMDNILLMAKENEQIKAKAMAQQELIDRAENIRESLKTETQLYEEQRTELRLLHDKQLLTTEEYASALEKLEEQLIKVEERTKELAKPLENLAELNVWQHMQKGAEKYADTIKSWGEEMENVVSSGFKSMEDALVEFTTTGKLSFRDMVKSMAEDLARLLIQQQITKPLAGAIGSMFGGGTFTPSGPTT